MRPGFVLILVTCVLLASNGRADGPASKKEDAAKKDLAALQGNWEIAEKEFMSKKASKEEVALLKGPMIIKGNTVRQWADDAGVKSIVSESTFTLDPTVKPKAVDFTFTAGMFKGEKTPAIYEVEGDTLRICYAMLVDRQQERPTAFAGKGDGKALLLSYKRVKK